MRTTDLTVLPKDVYGRGEILRRELTELVNYAQKVKGTSANAISTWFNANKATIQTALNAASPQTEA